MFIYVFDNEAKEKMISLGYKLLKESEDGSEFIFCADDNFNYNLHDIEYTVSDILTF